MSIFPVLYFTSLWLIYVLIGCLYLYCLSPFHPFPHPTPLWQPSVCSLYLWIYFCFILFVLLFIFILKRFYLFIFRERGREGKREGEKHLCERETPTGCLLYAPWPGTEPATQAHTLTGNWARSFSLCRMTPNQPSHAAQGCFVFMLHIQVKEYSICLSLHDWFHLAKYPLLTSMLL